MGYVSTVDDQIDRLKVVIGEVGAMSVGDNKEAGGDLRIHGECFWCLALDG